MTTDPNKTDRSDSLPVAAGLGEPVSRGSDWGVALAVLLFIWGGLVLLPGILVGGISFGTHTTLPHVLIWTLIHLTLALHGWAMIVAGINFCKARWRRGVLAIAVGVLVAAIVVTACAIVAFAIRMAS
jgi:hypothetical protein